MSASFVYRERPLGIETSAYHLMMRSDGLMLQRYLWILTNYFQIVQMIDNLTGQILFEPGIDRNLEDFSDNLICISS